MISGTPSGKETTVPSYGRACLVGPSITKPSWFPFLPNYHSFLGSLSHFYPAGLANIPFLTLGKHVAPVKRKIRINRLKGAVEPEACQRTAWLNGCLNQGISNCSLRHQRAGLMSLTFPEHSTCTL